MDDLITELRDNSLRALDIPEELALIVTGLDDFAFGLLSQLPEGRMRELGAESLVEVVDSILLWYRTLQLAQFVTGLEQMLDQANS